MFESLQPLTLVAPTSDPWANTFFGLNADERFPLLIIALLCATGILIALPVSLTYYWSRLQRDRMEMEMKREMLDRGMSAEQIATVIEATAPESFLDRQAASERRKFG